jgi:hypothetical protein
MLMVILGGVPAAIDFFNVLNDAAALLLVRGADFLAVFSRPPRDAWRCCSSVCVARKSLPPRSFGPYGFFP